MLGKNPILRRGQFVVVNNLFDQLWADETPIGRERIRNGGTPRPFVQLV
jgi:hypothetical protein